MHSLDATLKSANWPGVWDENFEAESEGVVSPELRAPKLWPSQGMSVWKLYTHGTTYLPGYLCREGGR